MKRFDMVCRLKPDRIEAYRKLHAEVWPEVMDMIRRCNPQNYSIFLKDDLLFSYFEYTGYDHQADMEEVFHTPD